jgi:hypothetical protein
MDEADRQRLLRQEFLIATTPTGLSVGAQALEQDLQFGILSTEIVDGHWTLIAFSSETRLVEWIPEGAPFIGLKGDDLLRLFLRGEWASLVIDPTADTIELSLDDVRALMAGLPL